MRVVAWLGDPADDLDGSLVLSGIQRGRHLGMECCCQGPGLRAVDGDLDEPQRVRVFADPTLLMLGVNVDPGDPLLVGLAVHRIGILDAVRSRCEPGRDAAALAEVVVVGARSVAFDVGPGSLRCTAVELHPAMPRTTASTTSADNQRTPRNAAWAPDQGRPIYGPS